MTVGTLQNILTVIGAVFGVLIGCLIGKNSVYISLNQSNSIGSEDTDASNPPQSKAVYILIGIVFCLFGILLAFFGFKTDMFSSSLSFDPNAKVTWNQIFSFELSEGTIWMFAAIFFGVGVLSLFLAAKTKKK